MTWNGDYLLDANGNRIGMAYQSGNLYTSIVFFDGWIHHIGKTSSIGGAKEQLEEWWRGVQEVKL